MSVPPLRLYAADFEPGDVISFDGDNPGAFVSVTRAGIRNGVGPETRDAMPRDAMPLNNARVTGGPMLVTRAGVTHTPWPYGLVASVDTETTGLGDDAQIVEVAVVAMRFGRVVRRFASLVNPGVPIPPEATAVHGITDAMVAGAPRLADLAAPMADAFAGCAVITGYNVVGYDEAILGRSGLLPALPVVDALPLVRAHAISERDGLPARRWASESVRREWKDDGDDGPVTRIDYRRVGRHSLERAARELCVDYPEPDVGTALHRATWDAILAGRVLYAMRRWCPWSAEDADRLTRDLHARQSAEQSAWRESQRAKRAASAPSVEDRIASLLAELRLLLAEQAGFAAWKAGNRKEDSQ